MQNENAPPMTMTSRRAILKSGVAGSAALMLAPVHGFTFFLRQAVADTDPVLPSPTITGTLSDTQKSTLFSITNYAATKWQITGFNALSQAEFFNFIDLKTGEVPSYYTAYEQLLSLYTGLISRLGSEDAAKNYLYTPNPPDPPDNFDTARFWGIQEFLILFITSGNFRFYGWKNYPGWMGGPFNNPNNLPYRGINDGD